MSNFYATLEDLEQVMAVVEHSSTSQALDIAELQEQLQDLARRVQALERLQEEPRAGLDPQTPAQPLPF